MLSPKTALASTLLEASSVCAFVNDFVGEATVACLLSCCV